MEKKLPCLGFKTNREINIPEVPGGCPEPPWSTWPARFVSRGHNSNEGVRHLQVPLKALKGILVIFAVFPTVIAYIRM